MANTIKTIHQELEELEHRMCYSYLAEMKTVLGRLQLPSTPTVVPVGTVIYRSRRHASCVRFWHKRCLNYFPEREKTRINRANLPRFPVFYGSFSSEEQREGWSVARREVDLREPQRFDTFTDSVWRVIEPFEVLPIIAHKKQAGKMAVALKMYESIQQQLAEMPEPDQKRARELFDVMAREFTEERTGLDYLRSASFAHILYEQFDGISYPSVRARYESFNVAIKPEIADKHLRFEGAQIGQSQFHRFSENDGGRYGLNYWITRAEDGEPFAWKPMEKKAATLADRGYLPWIEHE